MREVLSQAQRPARNAYFPDAALPLGIGPQNIRRFSGIRAHYAQFDPGFVQGTNPTWLVRTRKILKFWAKIVRLRPNNRKELSTLGRIYAPNSEMLQG